MRHRLAALATVLLLLLPSALPAAAKGDKGMGVIGAAFDAKTGVVAVDMRWHKRELKAAGENAGHLAVLAKVGDRYVRVHDEDILLNRKDRRRHELRLAPEELARLDGATSVVVAATHKHDDDGGDYDRAWYGAATVEGLADGDPPAPLPPCPGPLGPGVALDSCSLVGANLGQLDLTGAHLTNVDLSSAQLIQTTMPNAVLTGSTLSDASLLEANAAGVLLDDVTAKGVDMESAYLEGAELRQVGMTGANLQLAYMKSVLLDGVNLSNADAEGAFMASSDWALAWAVSARLSEVDLTDAHLGWVDLAHADLRNANLTNARLGAVQYCDTVMPDGSHEGIPCNR